MFSTILSEITENLDKRFVMNVFFPALLFFGSLVYLAHTNDTSDAIKAWSDQSIEIQIVMIIAFLSIVTFFAYILDGHLTHILRLYEGYWEDLPILDRLLSPKKRQHQIILQVAELQATCIENELTYLERKKDVISLEKGIQNYNSTKSDLDTAKQCLSKVEANLESARSKLNEAQKIVEGKTLQSWLLPNLNEAEDIIAGKELSQTGTNRSVQQYLNDANGLTANANESLNYAKKKIIISYPEKSTGAAEKASEKLTRSEEEIDVLMAVLTNIGPSLNSLQDRLWINKNKMKSLIKDIDSFKKEDRYFYAKNAERDSELISSILKSLETDLKAIGSDLISAKSISQTAKNHYSNVLENLRISKEEWNKLNVSEILMNAYKFSEDDEELVRIRKRKEEAISETKRVYEKIYFYYPPTFRPQEVMPTNLGNILKSAEIYPKERYNADAVFFWSKLYPLMSSEWKTSLVNARGSLDMMILISFLSFSLSILGGLILLISRAQPLQFLLVFLGLFILGWVAYKGAITYAVTYGDMIRSTFDLYRDKLIAEMGLKPPESIQAEKKFWDDLGQWLYRNAQSPIQYSNVVSSKEES